MFLHALSLELTHVFSFLYHQCSEELKPSDWALGQTYVHDLNERTTGLEKHEEPMHHLDRWYQSVWEASWSAHRQRTIFRTSSRQWSGSKLESWSMSWLFCGHARPERKQRDARERSTGDVHHLVLPVIALVKRQPAEHRWKWPKHHVWQ